MLELKLKDWQFRAGDELRWYPAIVPGNVHTDLLRNGLIPDPFFGTNEHDLQWIDKKDWEYETVLSLPPAWQEQERVELSFDGLDTYADVYVNGTRVLSADNMFRAWSVPVKDVLQAGDNKIRIRFRSPVNEDLPKLEALGYSLPAANDQSELGGLGDRRVSVFARKAPYHYGWDWGPRFVTSGIWREARLEAWSGPRITDLFIRQNEITSEKARLTAIVEVDVTADWQGTLEIRTEELNWKKELTLNSGLQTVEVELEMSEPRLWWCNGLGSPERYAFEASLKQGAKVIAARSVTTGLRSIKLVREKDEAGVSFRFELNGVAVFAKGANHIPNDSFIPDVTEARYRREIESAVRSNMNMLRIWGGGFYEENIFYELCDEHGILVWQDFMFACSMYPGDEDFLQSVKGEAEYNVVRLRNHPCIALWCGNNEIDSAWAHYVEDGGWGWKKDYTLEQREKIWADYEAIFHDLLPEVVERLGGGIDYWPSSPIREVTGDQRQHATTVTGEGDIHYWGVWHAVEPFSNYNERVGRFMSEYGFQSFPELSSVLKYADRDQLELESKVMLAHQKNGQGNRLIKQYMDQYLPEPKDFISFLYMSQVLQAEAIQTAIEAHRKRKPYCMGTLYWQMNDCWPVASWAGIDYYGRWKSLQYTVRRGFAEVILSVDSDVNGEVKVHAVSDRQSPVQGELKLALYDFNGERLASRTQSIAMAADSAQVIYTLPASDLLGGADPKSVILLATLEENGAEIAKAHAYFAPGRDISWPKASVTIREEAGSEGTRYIVETTAVARQVWLHTETEGVFSDNYFDLIPGLPVTVEFYRSDESGGPIYRPGTAGEVTVTSMCDYIV
ncbi:beta-mannosidase [Paenibacillus antibioticophila]|uniref:Beta-mannosidase B n=1 Tax=Paenibacillus antibioticophila TaxID=1274374 RepID=A0A920CJB8_9BACL|nr:glycoside hydrolase family 2 protein [Paenibacillus antibioticophila]GIO39568.1 beta-mannosidase [Paenibacillus antibioticophila]